MLLPGARFDVVAYACTSGTAVIGEGGVFNRIRAARPGVACTTPITAAYRRFKALGAQRIALLTPYIDEVNQTMRRFVEAQGVSVPVIGSFNHENDNEVARMSPFGQGGGHRTRPATHRWMRYSSPAGRRDCRDYIEAELGNRRQIMRHGFLALSAIGWYHRSNSGWGRLFRI